MLLDRDLLPSWFEYPKELLTLINQNLLDFDPWIILSADRLKERYKGLKSRYPSRELIPFARREDNDDVACWEKNKGVVIIHDFASQGFEGGKEVMTFWDWFKLIVNDMIDYNS
jgi:hypothetical protein